MGIIDDVQNVKIHDARKHRTQKECKVEKRYHLDKSFVNDDMRV